MDLTDLFADLEIEDNRASWAVDPSVLRKIADILEEGEPGRVSFSVYGGKQIPPSAPGGAPDAEFKLNIKRKP